MNKIFAFDYMLTLFIEWRREVITPSITCPGSLNKLSVLKLLFFTASLQSDKGDDLLDTFNKFYALPYGPVESDIYNAILKNALPSYKVSDTKIEKKDISPLPYPIDDFSAVKAAVERLINKNEELVLMRSFQLVDITHRWDSWKSAFEFAKFMDMYSYPMTTDSIRNDTSKCFRL